MKLQGVKNIVKVVICESLFYTGIFHLYMKGVFLRKKEFPAVVLNFHSFIEGYQNRVCTEPSVYMPIQAFEKMLRMIEKYFEIVSLDEVVKNLREGKKFNKPAVAITIDDGYKDNYEHLYPLLKERRVPATIFLTTEYIGNGNTVWFERLHDAISAAEENELALGDEINGKKYRLNSLKNKRRAYKSIVEHLKVMPNAERIEKLKEIEKQLKYTPGKDPKMLSWNQIKEMEKNNITFGAHTRTHPILSRMPLEEAKKEIFDSKHMISKKLGHAVGHFAVPNGGKDDFTSELEQYCRDIGFESVSSTVWGSNSKDEDRWSLKRVSPCLPMGVFAVYVLKAFMNQN